jgi:hypothetical protein
MPRGDDRQQRGHRPHLMGEQHSHRFGAAEDLRARGNRQRGQSGQPFPQTGQQVSGCLGEPCIGQFGPCVGDREHVRPRGDHSAEAGHDSGCRVGGRQRRHGPGSAGRVIARVHASKLLTFDTAVLLVAIGADREQA